jgi:D-glycero-D-manno-heptose 1,7-bisphosphate phosphatase
LALTDAPHKESPACRIVDRRPISADATSPVVGMSPTTANGRPAVFLDRDGTLIEDMHYLADPMAVTLVPGATQAVARLRAAGFAAIVTTNQSGIARGRITPDAYAAVKARLDALLEAGGTRLDATYMCPHHPDVTGPCDCRKPGTGLLTRARHELGIDLSRSVLIGDRWRDIAAAAELSARGILVPSPETSASEIEQARHDAAVARTLAAAVDMIVGR